MGKLIYLIKRIFGMNYRQMFAKIKEVRRKSGKSWIVIFFDMVYCGIVYQAGYMDYALFEMYDLDRSQRRTVVTRGINNGFIKKYNDPLYMPDIENKLRFAVNFSDFMHRDWLDVNSATKEEFDAFTLKHPVFMSKPVNGMCGKGIEKIDVRSFDGNPWSYVRSGPRVILEECVTQHEKLMALHPCSVNTCRVITLTQGHKTTVVAAYLRIGNGKVVDNFNSGGMVVPVEEFTGEIIYPALDKAGELYTVHPMTGVSIKGFKIPMWDAVLELVKKAGQVVPRVGLVGWDVCVTDSGPLLIEGNDFPGHDIYQLPPHRTNGIGVLPKFERAIKETANVIC